MTIEINTNQVRIGTNFVAKKNAVLTSLDIITNVETENTLPQTATTTVLPPLPPHFQDRRVWENINNITGIPEKAFVSNLEDDLSNSLEATKFGFVIPSNATIKGIQVQIRRKAEFANNILDVQIQLLKAGVLTGENKADLVNTWSATEQLVSYPKTGASTDLWGTDWTYEDINHDDFGVYIVVKEKDNVETDSDVMYIYIKIYYEIPEILKQYSKVIAVSYSTNNRITGDTVFKEVVIGGVPLSISAYSFGDNPSLFPDATIESNMYYALDIIEITENSDVETTTYDNNTFTYDGSRLSNLRLNNKNYINVSIQGNAGQPYHNTTIQGVPFALDENRCLIVNQSGYTFNNIEEIGEDPSKREPDIKELMIGGVPLSAGRVGNKYYLIVNALPAS